MKKMESLLVYPKQGSDLGLNFARDCALIIKGILNVKTLPIKEMEGDSVSEISITGGLSSMKKGNFLAFGHGTPDSLTVHESHQPVFFVRNTDNLSNFVCYFFSCCTAKKIGPAAIKKKALAFIGFREDFLFIPNYQQDFIECSISGIVKFLIGKCQLSEVEKITLDSYNRKIGKLINKKEFKAAQYLLHDLSSMTFFIR